MEKKININKGNYRQILDMSQYGVDIFDEFGKYNYTTVQQQLPYHSHGDMIEICYLSKGYQTYIVGDEEFELKGGDFFIAFPNEVHGTGKSPEEKGCLYWMVVKAPVSGEKYINLGSDDANAIYKLLLNIPKRVFKGSSTTDAILYEIFRTQSKERSVINKITMQNLIIRLLVHIIDKGYEENQKEQKINNRIESITHYIDEHIFEMLTIEELAEKCNLSLSRFKNVFKEETGIPPAEYVLRRKLHYAKKVLNSDKSMTVTQLAYDLGFTSPRYFSTVYKKYYGVSPKKR